MTLHQYNIEKHVIKIEQQTENRSNETYSPNHVVNRPDVNNSSLSSQSHFSTHSPTLRRFQPLLLHHKRTALPLRHKSPANRTVRGPKSAKIGSKATRPCLYLRDPRGERTSSSGRSERGHAERNASASRSVSRFLGGLWGFVLSFDLFRFIFLVVCILLFACLYVIFMFIF